MSNFSEMSAEDYVNELIMRTARSESVNIVEMVSEDSSNLMPNFYFASEKRRLKRCASHYVPPKFNESLIEQSQKFLKTDSAIYLKERGILRYMI